MNITENVIVELVEELLVVLDADAASLETTLEHLNNLRAAVIRRNETSLEQLLETIKSQKDDRDALENKRNNLRHILAEKIGCLPEQVNLSRIMENLTPVMRQKLKQRQQTLMRLVEKLKTEYTATAILLSECSRFNRVLLDSIIGSRCNSNITTYNASGQMKRPNGSGFVAMQF
jgi:hypothetical protein